MSKNAESKEKPSKNIESKERTMKSADREEYHVREQLLCKLCSEGYKEPRILPCLHSFCYDCLQKEMEKVGSQNEMGKTEPKVKIGSLKNICCPTCQKQFVITSVSELPQHLYLGFEVEVAGLANYYKGTTGVICDGCGKDFNDSGESIRGFCCECQEFLCKACLDYHKRNRNLSKHKIALLDESASIEDKLKLMIKEYNCNEHGHEKQVLDFYCATCTKPVCNYCVVSQHKEHAFNDLSRAASEQRTEMKQLQESVCNILHKLENATSNTDKMKQQVEASKKNATLLINSTLEDLHRSLQEREKALLTMVDKIAEVKTQSLQSQIDGFKALHSDVTRNNDMMTHTLQTNTDQQIVALRKVLHTSMKSMITDFEKVILLPNQHSSITVHIEKEPLSDQMIEFGCVDDCALSKSTWSWLSPSNPIPTPHVNVKYKLNIEMKNLQGEQLMSGGMPLVAEFTSKGQDQNISAVVEDKKNGTYTVSFTAASAGDYKVHICVQGHYIQNSPFDLKFVKRNYLTAKTLEPRPPAASCSQQGNWLSIAIHSDGSIFAGSYNGSYSSIHIHGQQDNKCIRSIGGANSSSNGNFNYPRGMKIMGEVLYVADANNHRIQKFKVIGGSNVEFQTVLWQGQLSQPHGLCTDTQGNVFVADYGNSRIQVFDANSSFVRTIPGNGSGNSSFANPTGVTFDHAGNIHIAAYGTGSIKVFSSEGKYLRMYGDGLKPNAIAIDSCGYCLVADSGTNQLRIYDPEGTLINSLTGLNNPTGIAVDQNGNLYVANHGSNHILQC